MDINIIRELVECHRSKSKTVFATFLDVSKAFDRLAYWILFDKTIWTINLPSYNLIVIVIFCFVFRFDFDKVPTSLESVGVVAPCVLKNDLSVLLNNYQELVTLEARSNV